MHNRVTEYYRRRLRLPSSPWLNGHCVAFFFFFFFLPNDLFIRGDTRSRSLPDRHKYHSVYRGYHRYTRSSESTSTKHSINVVHTHTHGDLHSCLFLTKLPVHSKNKSRSLESAKLKTSGLHRHRHRRRGWGRGDAPRRIRSRGVVRSRSETGENGRGEQRGLNPHVRTDGH